MSGLAAEGVTHAAFEASSHGLDQYRTEGLKVKAAAFTNLSHDHLDYHGTMEAYLRAKLRLFTDVVEPEGAAVVWADDDYSAPVIDAVEARGVRLLTVGTKGETLRLVSRAPTQLGQSLVIAAGDLVHKINLPLIGAYQGRERARLGGAGDRDRRRRGADACQSRAAPAGARAARTRRDYPDRRAGLCRLCPYARRDRGGARRAPPARAAA